MSEQRTTTHSDATAPGLPVTLSLTLSDCQLIRGLLRFEYAKQQRYYTRILEEAGAKPSALAVANCDTQNQILLELARIGSLVSKAYDTAAPTFAKTPSTSPAAS